MINDRLLSRRRYIFRAITSPQLTPSNTYATHYKRTILIRRNGKVHSLNIRLSGCVRFLCFENKRKQVVRKIHKKIKLARMPNMVMTMETTFIDKKKTNPISIASMGVAYFSPKKKISQLC